MKSNRFVVATVVAVLAIAAMVGGAIWSSRGEDAPPTAQQTPSTLLSGTQAVWANPSAPIAAEAPVVEVFEDFQCGHCHDLEKVLGPTLRDLAAQGSIRLGYHMMTFLDEQARNTASRRAAIGAVCAADAGTLQAFHDGVFATAAADAGQGWTDAELRSIAQQAGVSGSQLTAWDACVADQRYAAYVSARTSEPWKIKGFEGTPRIMINGAIVTIAEIASPELLTAALAKANS